MPLSCGRAIPVPHPNRSQTVPNNTPPRPHELRVIMAKQREHLPRILELEQAASADRTKIYDGQAWNQGASGSTSGPGSRWWRCRRETTWWGFLATPCP